jgi:hypothetical protein
MKKSFGYLTREGFKNVWANRLMSLASVGVLVACMALIGIALLLTSNFNTAINALEKQNVVMVYFQDKNSVLYPINGDPAPTDKNIPDTAYKVHNEQEAKALCDKIAAMDNVLDVEYISPEQAYEDYKENYADENAQYLSLFEGDENPMPMGARVTLDMEALGTPENVKATKDLISKVEGVDTVISSDTVTERLANIRSAVEIAGFWIIAVLMLISLVIVCNTIRVTMYNRKLEISIMKAVGATDWFIRWPFLIEGIILGVVSAIISLAFTFGIYTLAGDKIKETMQSGELIPFSQMALPLFGIFVGIGVLAGVIGSIIILNKYLKKEGSEFRAL